MNTTKKFIFLKAKFHKSFEKQILAPLNGAQELSECPV